MSIRATGVVAAPGLLSQIDPRLFSKSSSLRQVTNRVGLPSTFSASIQTICSRTWQMSYVPLTQLQVAVYHGYVGSPSSYVETGPAAAATYQVAVEYPAGTWTTLPWSGANTGSVAGNAIGTTDLATLPAPIPAFTRFRIEIYVTCASGLGYSSWANAKDTMRGDEWAHDGNAAGKALGGAVTNLDQVSQLWPALVLGYSSRVVWGLIGDSIVAGVNDTFPDPSGGRGLLGRALAKAGPHVNYGCPGDRAQCYVASHANRLALMQMSGATKLIDEYGVNDINGGRTAAQLQADRATIRGYFPGLQVFDTTVTPQTTSTDSFKTAANQTVSSSANNTQRVAFNNALRGPQVTFASPGVVDLAGVVETSTGSELGPVQDGGVWIPSLATDGTHPNTRADVLVEASVAGLVASLGGPS